MKQIHILLVEDNEADIFFATEILEETKTVNKISVVKDGRQAIDFLNKAGKYSDIEHPDLILLDINLPKRNGHDVLQYIKTNEKLKHIIVIMLSTSSSESDIKKAYKNFADGYITKPLGTDDLIDAISKIEGSVSPWLNLHIS
ncbi:MAG: response regulator [Ginsengibacter sp.]